MTYQKTTNQSALTKEPQFKKVLSSVDAYAMGFGSMIGFGWVVLTGGWLENAGTMGAVIALVIGGLIMLLVGLIYGELTSSMPKAGGEHHYLMRGMGARWSFIGSWGITGGYVTIVAFEAVALPRTIEYIAPQIKQLFMWNIFGSDVFLLWAIVGVVAAVIITWINYVGIKAAGIVQTFVVLFLIIVGLLLAFGSVTAGTLTNMQPMFTDMSGLLTVLVVVPFLFVGFDVIPQTAEEINMPPRKIGRLIAISVMIATAWYVLVALSASSAMSRDEMAGSSLVTADAMGTLFNSDLMANILIAGGIAGILTSWIALLIGASRLMYAMGYTGMLPRWFGKLHPKYRTPSNAILFIGGLSVLAPFLGEGALEWLVDSGSPSIVITYLLVCIVFVILRKKEPQMVRPYKVGGQKAGKFIGILGIVVTVGLISLYIPGMPASIDAVSYLLFGAWWILGAYFLFKIPRGITPGPNAEEELRRLTVSSGR